MGKKIKRELIQKIADIEGRSEREVRVIVNAFVNQIREALISGDDVVLNNLGAFVLEDTSDRTIVNYLPGFVKAEHHIAPTKIVKFKVSKNLQTTVKRKNEKE